MNSLSLTQPDQLLELALKAGASDAEVYQSQSFTRPVTFEANRLKQLESNQSAGIALRVWRQGRPGLAVGYGAIEPQLLVEKAIALSRLSEPEPLELADQQTLSFPTTGQWLEVEPLIELGQTAIATLRDTCPELICHLTLQCEQEQTVLLNSRGLQAQYEQYTSSLGIDLEWVRGEDFLGIYDGLSDSHCLDISPLLRQLTNRLQWAQNHAPTPRNPCPVLLTPKAADLLWDVVVMATDGQQVVEGASPWSQRRNKQVTTNTLTLRQDPQQGSDRTPIDDEGTHTQALTLIEQGQLQQFYCDRATGRKLDQRSTGNGFRASLSRTPAPSLVNLMVQPGTQSFEQLVQSLDRAIVVDQVLGGGADLSGELSVNLELGFVIEQGAITGRLKDTMLAGNLYTVLNNAIVLGNDVQWQGNYHTPSAIVHGLAIVA